MKKRASWIITQKTVFFGFQMELILIQGPQCIFVTGDSYDLWDRTEIWGSLKPFKPIWDLSPQFVNTLGQSVPMFGGGSTLGPANVYTYRTSDFMLSSSQNYRSKFFLDAFSMSK